MSVDITFHYPPELFNLLVDTVSLINRSKKDVVLCRRRLNFDPPCRLIIDPGTGAAFGASGCG
jgi:hypothetical protein